METVLSPHEQGSLYGTWTAQRLEEDGWKSPHKCLKQQEENYQQQLAQLPELREKNPEYASLHAQYLEGWITTARQTLGALIALPEGA